MYMRYAGSGVGHYSVALSDTHANPNETPNEDFAMDDDTDLPRSVFPTTQPTNLEESRISTAGHEEVEDGGQADDDIESDSSEGSDEEENPDQDDNDDLGAEDGEGGFVDVEDDEGYAVL
jgi:hypothetical protein